MTTRLKRPGDGTVRAALLALVLLCLVPLFGVAGAANSPSTGPTAERAATAVVSASWADPRVEDRGCHEGQPGAPGGAPALSPDQSGPHAPKSAPAPPRPQDDVPALAAASPPDATSVDLHRIQICRT
ncbi:hypothetical protein [Streptomyces kanamyceticus]|uniref:hypothetical protein n=1 Tax=Streptomyces kanamyceticus TaxID=1967 RepID=UPI00123D2D06|nr:hypothetical protein [Streptomyces kanamyceticus]